MLDIPQEHITTLDLLNPCIIAFMRCSIEEITGMVYKIPKTNESVFRFKRRSMDYLSTLHEVLLYAFRYSLAVPIISHLLYTMNQPEPTDPRRFA